MIPQAPDERVQLQRGEYDLIKKITISSHRKYES